MEKRLIQNCKWIAFLLSFGTNLLAPVLLMIREDLGVDLSESGFLMSCFFAGNFIGCFFCAKISNFFGEQKVLTIATASMAVFGLAIAGAPSYIILCFMLFGFGFSSLLLQVTTSVLPEKIITVNSEASLSGITAFNGLGSCIGFVYSGALVTFGFSWRVIYLLFAVFALVVMIRCLKTPKFEKLQCQEKNIHNVFQVLREKSLWLIFISLILYTGTETSVSNWVITYLVQEHNFSALNGSMISAVIWMSAFVGRILCEKISNCFPKVRLELLLIPMAAAATLVFPNLRGIGVWAGAIIVGLAISGLWPLIAAKIMHCKTYDRSAAMSTAFLSSFSGGVIIPYMIGIAGEHTTMAEAIRLNGYLFIALFVVYIIWMVKKRAD